MLAVNGTLSAGVATLTHCRPVLRRRVDFVLVSFRDPKNEDLPMMPVVRYRYPPFEEVGALHGVSWADHPRDNTAVNQRGQCTTCPVVQEFTPCSETNCSADFEVIAGLCVMDLAINHIEDFSQSAELSFVQQLMPVAAALEKQVHALSACTATTAHSEPAGPGIDHHQCICGISHLPRR